MLVLLLLLFLGHIVHLIFVFSLCFHINTLIASMEAFLLAAFDVNAQTVSLKVTRGKNHYNNT